ncbi:MAG: threonylcarbamoyl-AMP synthase [Methanoregulaceae archaeon]|nr:threonylcarbamoyl-AMP synthase [Methanoregulaceae archaeon]
MDLIQKAVRVLMSDGLVVYPTETVYGLGADALSDIAIDKVYEAKHRMIGKPISIAVSDDEMLHAVARVEGKAEEFITAFLPGPVTVVLKARSCIPDILTGGTGLIGIRIPAHEVPVAIIRSLDAPITATSANQSGGKDPVTTGECHVPYDLIIEGGRLPGTPSTVVDLVDWHIIRSGAQSAEIGKFISQMRSG